jgi:DNA-binding NarL/FixJ family response regulator
MDKLLIVDTDNKTVNDIVDALVKLKRFETLTAFDSKTAVDLINNHTISVLISGFHLPDFDGIELFAYMTRAFPATPCIAMLDPGHPRPWFVRQDVSENLLEFVEKPVELDILVSLIDTVLRLKQQGLAEKGMNLRNFLPLVDAFKKSCQMEVRNDKKNRGRMYFLRGCMIEAHCEAKIGDAALEEMLEWDHCKISISRLPANKKEDLVGIALMTRIGVSWEKKSLTTTIPAISCTSETIPPLSVPEEPPSDQAFIDHLEGALKKYAGVLKTIKGYLGLAVLTASGQVLAADNTGTPIDFSKFTPDFTAVFNQCSSAAGRQGFDKCIGFTAHTEKGVIIMIPAGDYRFIALMSPEGNGFFMQIQLEKIIPQIVK